jgi:hypothetical protein
MNEEQKIIELYKSGLGSTSIEKTLNISKRKILKVINSNGLLRNRNTPEETYSNYFKENNQWCTHYTCNCCNNNMYSFLPDDHKIFAVLDSSYEPFIALVSIRMDTFTDINI